MIQQQIPAEGTLQRSPLHSFCQIYSLPHNFQSSSNKWKVWYKRIKLFFFENEQTLYHKYKYVSQLIISNACNSFLAMEKSNEYEIPYVEILINNQQQEQIVRDRLLLGFQIAHFMNQNFLTYGQWMGQKIKQKENLQSNQQQKGKMLFRNGFRIYGFIELSNIQNYNDEELKKSLEELRNKFYDEKIKAQEMNQREHIDIMQQQPQQNLQQNDFQDSDSQLSHGSNYQEQIDVNFDG